MINIQPDDVPSLHVMIVDDEELIANLLKAILINVGCKVTAFGNGVMALEDFVQHPDVYDVVISDLNMPTMKGNQLAEELLKVRPDLPVILCTGYTHDLDVIKLRKLGVRQFLNKPVENKTLVAVINELRDEIQQPPVSQA